MKGPRNRPYTVRVSAKVDTGERRFDVEVSVLAPTAEAALSRALVAAARAAQGDNE